MNKLKTFSNLLITLIYAILIAFAGVIWTTIDIINNNFTLWNILIITITLFAIFVIISINYIMNKK